MQDKQSPTVHRFIFQFRLFCFKSSTWMTTNRGLQLMRLRAGLLPKGTKPGRRSRPTGICGVQQGQMQSPAPQQGGFPAAAWTGPCLMPGWRATLPEGICRTASTMGASILCCIEKSVDSRLKEELGPLYSARFRPLHLVWDTQYNKTSVNCREFRGRH